MTRLTEELFRYSVILAEEEPLAHEPVVLNDALAESLASFYGAAHIPRHHAGRSRSATRASRVCSTKTPSRVCSPTF